ncbi:MAG TPA: AIR synthase-related protein [Candidatus Saccharimonadales bacterium]|nr:AIR synthase-related protein [Candidatus Saccharimonadales bacterium]
MEAIEGATYGEVGVDVDVEAKAAKILFGEARGTFENRNGKLGEVHSISDSFSGVRFSDIGGLPIGVVDGLNSDGVGTKPVVVMEAGVLDTIAIDLISNVSVDAAIKGADPAHVSTILKVNTLGKDESRLHLIRDLASGYLLGARDAGIAVTNGEIAQHNDAMDGDPSKFSFDWDATVKWYAHEDRLAQLDGSRIEAGDFLVALKETGLRCNGISLVRQILKSEYDDEWGEVMFEGQRLVDLVLQPPVAYTRAIVEMTGADNYGVDRKGKLLVPSLLRGGVHVSGSGIPGKLARFLFPRGKGAFITDLYEPSKLIERIQTAGRVTDWEIYRTLCMGQGAILICSADDSQDVINIARKHLVESKVVGLVTNDPTIAIESRGLERDYLTYVA